MSPTIDLQVKFSVIDEQLSALHARAFGYPLTGVKPWTQRLERHSLTWIGAFIDEQLVGFVHACWDGGAHAFLLDTAGSSNFAGWHSGITSSSMSRVNGVAGEQEGIAAREGQRVSDGRRWYWLPPPTLRAVPRARAWACQGSVPASVRCRAW